MSTPDDLDYVLAHPMPGPEHMALLASCHLLVKQTHDCFPVRVRESTPTSPFESWEVTRASFVARMASTLRHLQYLAPSYSRLDGYALARTLVDHAITFAWISGNPKEHLPMGQRPLNSTLNKDVTATERGAPLLKDAERARMQSYVDLHKDSMPKLPRRAEAADVAWGERVRSTLPKDLHIVQFDELYHDIYSHYATFDHPTTLGLPVFVHMSGTPATVTVDGEPERDLVKRTCGSTG